MELLETGSRMRNNLQDQTSELMRQLTALQERASNAADASRSAVLVATKEKAQAEHCLK